MRKVFRGKVAHHQLLLEDPMGYDALLYSLEGKDITLALGKQEKQRSLPQNAYYRGPVIKKTSNYFGYTPDEMHEAFRLQFLVVHNDGKPDTIRSTADLTTAEFETYLAQIKQLAAEYGCYVPDPNEYE